MHTFIALALSTPHLRVKE
uniref:Uncharacterized protein n=1 Tax=Rhizophora mucronata TaxID=61149 RepID=A0A2P2QZE8_RHIMU